ncbi:uncharacterized protein J3D65DRAFT_58265 [Phyllosticta citribraziliensis]|uniref:Uncharacterized protein n=1 Tax=Phyllosticta citribraziliensis TaxID=989973 RepID=A0ABR1LC93_9PEZI
MYKYGAQHIEADFLPSLPHNRSSSHCTALRYHYSLSTTPLPVPSTTASRSDQTDCLGSNPQPPALTPKHHTPPPNKSRVPRPSFHACSHARPIAATDKLTATLFPLLFTPLCPSALSPSCDFFLLLSFPLQSVSFRHLTISLMKRIERVCPSPASPLYLASSPATKQSSVHHAGINRPGWRGASCFDFEVQVQFQVEFEFGFEISVPEQAAPTPFLPPSLHSASNQASRLIN